MSDPFISFHNHCSQGSLLDSIAPYTGLLDKAKELGQEAFSLSDHGSVFAIHDAYKYSKKIGIKLICSNEFYFKHDPLDPTEKGNKHMVLIAQNAIGWKNILRLNYIGWTQQKLVYMKYYPVIGWKDISQYNEGIICLTACSSGILARHIMNDNLEQANLDTAKLKSIFGDNLFLEVQPHLLKTENGKVDQVRVNNELIKIARDQDIKIIGTCDAHYLTKDDAIDHDLLLAIKDQKSVYDENRHKYSVDEFYPKPGSAMLDFFGKDIGEEIIRNCQLINSRCEVATYLEPGKVHLPTFPVSDAADYKEFLTWKDENIKVAVAEDIAYLRYKTMCGFKEKQKNLEPEQVEHYWNRLKEEVKVIEDRHFSSYMLIVADFISWAKTNDVLIGTARGSAAGSLVSNILGITSVDPMKHNLLFARFLNKLKKAYPDIDVDMAYPDKIKEYVKKKYGEKRVSGVLNVNKMKPKVVLKDVARSLELGGGIKEAFAIANEITKLIPDNDIKTVDDAIKAVPELNVLFKKYPQLLAHCQRLQNIEKSHGQHAAGVIIADEDIHEIAPVRMDKEGNLIIGFDKEQCEENNFIKFDFLGLKTLIVIDEAIKAINKYHNKNYTMETLPLDDQNVYGVICKGDVKGVFQLEETCGPSCVAIQPKNIEDLAAITTLIRPGIPLEQRELYVERRFGRASIEYIHPKLEEATKETFGILIYDEQLMFVGKEIANWEFDKGDVFRKITKLKEKGKELADKTEKEFIDGALVNGVSLEKAQEIWELAANFGKYSFNKSHAISYSYISYYTAWLKYYYPAEFMAALLNQEEPNSEKAQEYKQYTRDLGIKITPPDVNTSALNYIALSNTEISTGLLALKGAGDDAIKYMIARRPYVSYKDFLYRLSGTKGNRSPVNKRLIDAMAKSGSFDSFKLTRKNALEAWPKLKEDIQKGIKKQKENFHIDSIEFLLDDPEAEYTKKEIMAAEKEVLGEYISGTAAEIYKDFFNTNDPHLIRFADMNNFSNRQSVKVEAIIKIKTKEQKIKKAGKNFGKMFAKFSIQDRHGDKTELVVWPDQYKMFKKCLLEGLPIRMFCSVSDYMGVKTLTLGSIEDIPNYIERGEIINEEIRKIKDAMNADKDNE